MSILYIASNFVYLGALPLEAIQNAPEDRVATAVVAQDVRSGGGPDHGRRHHGLDLRMRQRHHPFGRACITPWRSTACSSGARRRLHPHWKTPAFALGIQCFWAVLLTLSGRYGDLLDYVIFAVLLFYILTIAGVFALRRARPEMERPYRAFGYPVLPAFYILTAGLIEILLLIYKPSYTWPGLIIVLLGVPVYYLWRTKEVKR